MIDKAK